MYFLKVNGYIPKNKFRELEQSFNLLNLEQLHDCKEFKLLQEFQDPEYVQFFSLWSTQESLERFMSNKSYIFLKGIFKALGVEKEITYGHYSKHPLPTNN